MLKSLRETYRMLADALGDEREARMILADYADISYADTRKYLAAEFFDGNLNFIYKESRYSAVGNSGHDSMPGGTQPD